MHQVLGKRVETQLPRDLNPPVKPMSPSDAPSAVRSDSRLDARQNAPVRQPGRAPRDVSNTPLKQPRGGGRQGTPSAQVNFTPTARSIADLLMRFPVSTSTSTVRVSQPLFPSNTQPAPTQVAQQLQTSVRESGLFYESHLARWYRGGFSREQLQREPQMWRTLTTNQAQAARPAAAQAPPTAAAASQPGQAQPAGQQAAQAPPAAPAASQTGQASQPAGQQATQAPPAAPAANQSGQAQPQPAGQPATQTPTATALAATAAREGNAQQQQAQIASAEMAALRSAPLQRGSDPIHESLQGLVRQQLEMLATPVLRWEGDVWSGIFMALMIQPPPRRDDERQSQGEDAHEQEDDSEAEWHSSMTLRVRGLGDVGVKLWLSESRLNLELSTSDGEVRSALAQGIERLKSRLQTYAALNDIEIRLRSVEPEATPETELEPEPERTSAPAPNADTVAETRT